MLTGRPLCVNPEINAADAFVVAWLPGSEGEGVADMLLGDKAGKVAHEFRGTLSFPWPATADAKGKHLFELGRSEEHTSELQSLMRISYAVFCLKKKKTTTIIQ